MFSIASELGQRTYCFGSWKMSPVGFAQRFTAENVYVKRKCIHNNIYKRVYTWCIATRRLRRRLYYGGYYCRKRHFPAKYFAAARCTARPRARVLFSQPSSLPLCPPSLAFDPQHPTPRRRHRLCWTYENRVSACSVARSRDGLTMTWRIITAVRHCGGTRYNITSRFDNTNGEKTKHVLIRARNCVRRWACFRFSFVVHAEDATKREHVCRENGRTTACAISARCEYV